MEKATQNGETSTVMIFQGTRPVSQRDLVQTSVPLELLPSSCSLCSFGW